MALHPKGLTPFEAAKVWHLRQVQKLPWRTVREQVRAVNGDRPNRYALGRAVRHIQTQRHTAAFRRAGTAVTAYGNCGRTPVLTPQQKSALELRDKYLCA